MTVRKCKVCDAFEFEDDAFGKMLIELHFMEEHPELYMQFLEEKHPEAIEKFKEWRAKRE